MVTGQLLPFELALKLITLTHLFKLNVHVLIASSFLEHCRPKSISTKDIEYL